MCWSYAAAFLQAGWAHRLSSTTPHCVTMFTTNGFVHYMLCPRCWHAHQDVWRQRKPPVATGSADVSLYLGTQVEMARQTCVEKDSTCWHEFEIYTGACCFVHQLLAPLLATNWSWVAISCILRHEPHCCALETGMEIGHFFQKSIVGHHGPFIIVAHGDELLPAAFTRTSGRLLVCSTAHERACLSSAACILQLLTVRSLLV